jgi:hypothetical protein
MTILSKNILENEETQMRLKSTERENHEYFATWNKKIENTSMRMVSEMAMLVIIFVILNIFAIAIVVKLNLY